MANEPEIKIKINFEEADAQAKLEQLKKTASELVSDTDLNKSALKQVLGKTYDDITRVLQMQQRIKETGLENLETFFTAFYDEPTLKYAESIEKEFEALDAIPKIISNLNEQLNKGEITLEQYAVKISNLRDKFNEINYDQYAESQSETALGLNFGLKNTRQLEHLLDIWSKPNEQIKQNIAAAKEQEAAARDMAKALREEKKNLDVNSEGYEKRLLILERTASMYDSFANKNARVVEQLEKQRQALTEAMKPVSVNDPTNAPFYESKKNIDEQVSGIEKQKEKLKELDEERESIANLHQVRLNRVAEAERQAEEKAKERAEAEAKRIAKKEELAQREKFAMELVGQSRQQLIETIKRLTEEQKKASEAGDKEAWKTYTLQITAARHQLERLRSTTNLSRIAFMQQAQTAQQLGQGFRTLVDTVTNFGKAAENGTLNLTGLTSTLMSLGYAVKAGLGPLGWAMTAVELLTSAWNIYAKEQKKVEEAEKKRKEAAAALVTEYINAANEAERLRDAEADRSKIDALTSGYRDLNTALRNRNELLSTSLRMLNAEAAMKAKEDEFENTVAKNDILVSYYTGKITEEQRDKLLDELDAKKAAQKGERAVAQASREAETKRKLEANMFQYMRTVGERKSALDLEGQKYMYSDADMQKFLATYVQADSSYKKASIEADALTKRKNEIVKQYFDFDEKTQKYNLKAGLSPSAEFVAPDLLKIVQEIDRRLEVLNLDNIKQTRDSAFAKFGDWEVSDIESGKYGRMKKSHDESVQVAQNALNEANKEWQRAKAEKDAAEEKLRLAEATAKQDAKLAERTSGERTRLRNAKKEFETAKRAEETAARIRKEAEAEAARAAAASMKLAEEHEKLLASSEWAISKNNPNRLRDEDAKNVNTILNKLLPEAVDGKLTEKQLKLLEKKMDAADKSKTEVDDKLIKMVAKYLDVSLIKNKKLSARVDALQRDL